MNRLILAGCTAEPLSHYLKALGILRLVAGQLDHQARGCWLSNGFLLETTSTAEDVERFFLEHYAPSPVVAPWNGDSGFCPGVNEAAIARIEESTSERYAPYRETVSVCKKLRLKLGITEKPEEKKGELLRACRSWMPDEAVTWMDAALVLSPGRPSYPPILGTGGGDGRLDFSNNFMQRLTDVVGTMPGEVPAASRAWLRNSLWGDAQAGLQKAAIGQFNPSGAGGANGTSGFGAEALINPWDFVLMLEGALLFAAASTRRLGSTQTGMLSCPFTVHTVGAGFGSAATADTGLTRAELWVPIWDTPASLPELKVLFSEGRARVCERAARNGVDFARAVCTLGVDRGLREFVRYAFLERNGQAYLAVPVGRYPVSRRPEVSLIDHLDSWLETLRGRAAADRAPATVRRAVQNLEDSILALCRQGRSRLLGVLVATGHCERALAKSIKWTLESFVPPCPRLPIAWLRDTDEDSAEYRLAASLASLQAPLLRSHIEQIAPLGGAKVWFEALASNDVVWSEGELPRALNAIMHRRILAATREGSSLRPLCRRTASLMDVASFIDGQVDDSRLSDLVWALSLLDWTQDIPRATPSQREGYAPDASYALLKLCFVGSPVRDVSVPVNAEIHRRAAGGDGLRATESAIRRLRGSGLVPAVRAGIPMSRQAAERTAASLLFPLSSRSIVELTEMLHIRVPDDAALQPA